MMALVPERLISFLAESLAIEGICRPPSSEEITAALRFLLQPIGLRSINKLQTVIAPGLSLRDAAGMDVRVGSYSPPPGGPEIPRKLRRLLNRRCSP